MKKIALLCIATVVASIFAAPAVAEEKTDPIIQIAILLDTSNSMDGLIHQAKTQLWKIVNEVATVKRDGKVPVLQVALYEYGKSSLPAREGFLRMILGMTTDLDKVSEELFALTTNGGSEYCGWVIQRAVQELTWSKSNADFKAIFIAGNEPFTQGTVDFRNSCKQAISQGIVVNTIHCGSYQEGVNGMWQQGALLADGSYMNIDQNLQVIEVPAPQDQKIVKLNEELNTTYLGYGREGKVSKERQMTQDANARGVSSESNVQRAMSKSSAHYRNASWDLVDAIEEGTVKIEDVKTEDLPPEMQKMTVDERKAFIAAQTKKRAEIQEEIKKLSAERNQYVAEEMKKLQASGENSLDTVMIQALRKQLEKKKFQNQ